jgi:prepilin-type N-terminal cleavage/methylation domain-containing protein
MNLQNIKKMKEEKGFTIVELLIVIVVIGILAAIIIVAYNGVQNRARTTEAQSNAKEVQNKAETFNADEGNGSYPANSAALVASTGSAKLSTKVAGLIQDSAVTSAAPTRIQYKRCTSNGAQIYYWDYGTNNVSTTVYSVGDTSSC